MAEKLTSKRDETRAQERVLQPAMSTDMKREQAKTFQVIIDAAAAKKQAMNRKEGPVTFERVIRSSRCAISHITTRVEEAITNTVLGTLTAQDKETGNRLSIALESLDESIIEKWFSLPRVNNNISEAVIRNPGLITSTVAFIKLEKGKHTDGELRIGEYCRQ